MTIQVTCGECGKGYRIPDEKAGRKIRCRQCEAVIRIPDVEDEHDEDAYEDDGHEERYAAPSRRGTSTSGKGRQAKSKAGPGIGLIIGSVGALLVVGVAGAFVLNGDAEDPVDPAEPNEALAIANDPANVPANNPADDPAADESPDDPAIPAVAGGDQKPGVPVAQPILSPAVARLSEVKPKFVEIMVALHNHHDSYGMFNPDTRAPENYAADGRPHVSWRVHILPFLGRVDLYRQFKRDEAWDSPHNMALLPQMPDIYRSPGDPADSTTTRFRGVESVIADSKAVITTMFAMTPGGRQIRMRDVMDGTSNTVMFVETVPDKAVPWTKPEELPLVSDDPASAFGEIDPVGIPIALADGRCMLAPADLSPQVWANLICPTNRTPVPRDILTAIPDLPVPKYEFTPRTDAPLHLAYWTPDTIGLVIARPQAMAATASVKAMLTEMSEAQAIAPDMRETLEDLETVVFWVTPGDRQAPAHALLRFSSVATLEEVARKIKAPPGELLQHDSRTWLVAGPTFLKKMAKASSTPSALASSLRDVDLSRHVFARFDMQSAFEQVAQLGTLTESPQMNGLRQIQQIDATLDWSGSTLLNIQARTSSAAIATLLSGQISQGMETEVPPGTPPPVKLGAEVLRELLTVEIDASRDDTVNLTLRNSAELETTLLAPLREALIASGRAAIRAQQRNNLRQIGLAIHNHHDVHRKFPVADNPKWFNADGQPHLSWRVHVLPFLGQVPLYQKFRLDEPWDSPNNMALLDQMPEVYKVPGVEKAAHTSVMTFAGPGSAFPDGKGPSMPEIRDGSSKTIAIVQAGPDKAVPWTKPIDLQVNTDDPFAPLGEIGSSFNALMFDGAVRSVSSKIEPDALLGQINPRDGR